MTAAMPASGLDSRSLARRLRKLGERAALIFVRYSVHVTAAPDERPACYVLERDQLFDRLVLRDLCARQGWRAGARLPDGGAGIWSLREFRGIFARHLAPAGTARLATAITWLSENRDADLLLVPVAVFWGRSPAKERSWLKLLLTEDWAAAGRIRRFFAILVYGRQVLVKVSHPVSLRQLVDENLAIERTTRKAARLLRVHFRRQRAATIGPDLSHRRLLVDEVLASPAVRQAIQREVQINHRPQRRVDKRARGIAYEIAAHYSHAAVRLFEYLFAWLWNRLYEGIEIRHFDRLHDIAVGAEVIYVPCHRSHVDYMLLSYVIYKRGLASPHIAAGINLNLPLIGPFLRRGGAFFMRRSFRGDALYSAVFRSYLAALLSRGFPIEFFVEGTRSRTGRLLGPKLGLLGATVETYLRDPRRPIVYVPVYFGYEKLVEAQSFAGELRGGKKQRETLGSMLRALRALRERFGSVDVSFGEPIWLDEMLDRSYPDWRREDLEHFFRPPWVEQAVAALGRRIMTAINEAAVANSVGLTALIVLSTPKHAIVEAELRAQLSLYLELSRLAPYSPRAGVTSATPAAIVAHCEEIRWLQRRPHRLGDVLYMDERRAVLASYHRNNIVHLFALPGLVGASLNNRASIQVEELHATIRRLYPFFKAELFLRAEPRELDAEIDRAIAALTRLGLVEREPGRIHRPPEGTAAAAQFMLCSAIVEPFAEHYYLCVIYLLEHGSGALDKGGVVEQCADAAERLAMLYTLNSPDLFEAGLFGTLIDALTAQGLLTEEADGRLSFGEPLALVAEDLAKILRPRVRQTLRLFAGAATTLPPGAAVVNGAPVGRSAEPR
jgi:glycerol-3-phosphate O-acyltransferase